MLTDERASVLIRRARHAAGLTQGQLAALAGTSQSAIAAYESGAREPTLPVMDRMIRASGHVLSVTIEPDPRVFRLADLADQIRATDDEQRRMRLVFEFLRGAQEDGRPVQLLGAAEPGPTGDRRFDALLAAIAEDLCVHADIPPPSWVNDPDRYLDGFWWVSNLPSARARAVVHTPASYRRRGVMLDRHDLAAA
jgi:transcriptional regulator with XRE-family HTH domain